MKMTKTKLAKGFTLVELLVVIAIIAALAALSTPVVLKQQKKAASTTAINNAKQIFLLLFEYDQDTGAYPTAAAATTNVIFRDELFKKGYTTSEEIFYAKGPIGTIKPDGNIGVAGTNAEAIAAGEGGFKYVKGLSASSASGLPLLGAPFAVKTAAKSEFDADTYGNKAVVLTNDGAVKTINLIFNTATPPVALAAGGGDADIFASTKLGATLGNLTAAD